MNNRKYKGFVGKLNSRGEVLWLKELFPAYIGMTNVIESLEGSVIAVGGLDYLGTYNIFVLNRQLIEVAFTLYHIKTKER